MKRVVVGVCLSLFPLFFSIPARSGEVASKQEAVFASQHQHKVSGTTKRDDLISFSRLFVDVAKECTPAVVFIQVEGGVEQSNDPYDMFGEEFFYHFFGGPRHKRYKTPQISQGSGFLISSDGYIMTNLHVLRGANKIFVHVQGDDRERRTEATFVGADPQTDIAVIKINETGRVFPYLEFANSDKLEVGEWVLAIGSPFRLESSVSAGIVSATGRRDLQITDFEDFIQTDASVNCGQSGGPLVTLRGEVVGMNTAIISTSGGNMGISFAIPSNILQNRQHQLIASGQVSQGYLGVTLQPIDENLAKAFKLESAQGALVTSVVEDSPAKRVGLRQGDIITKINETPVKDPAMLRKAIVMLSPDTTVQLTIKRDSKVFTVSVTLGTYGQDTSTSSAVTDKRLGLSVDNLTSENVRIFKLRPESQGVVVTGVDQGASSLAAQAGIRPGFVIIAVNHVKVANVKEFTHALENVKEGGYVVLLVQQGELARFYSFKVQGSGN